MWMKREKWSFGRNEEASSNRYSMCKRVINYSICLSPFFVFFFFSEFLLSSRSIRKYIYTRSVLLHLIYPISVIIERMIALPSVLSNVYKFNSTLVFCVCVRVCMCSRVCACVRVAYGACARMRQGINTLYRWHWCYESGKRFSVINVVTRYES